MLTSKNSNLVDRLGFKIYVILFERTYDTKSTSKKSLIGRCFGEAFATVVELSKHAFRLGLLDLIWPLWHLAWRSSEGLTSTLVVKIVETSRCSIYEIPCTKLGFNSILVTLHHSRFLTSHWLIYYPFGLGWLATSLVQKWVAVRSGLGWLSCLTEIEPIRY